MSGRDYKKIRAGLRQGGHAKPSNVRRDYQYRLIADYQQQATRFYQRQEQRDMKYCRRI